MFARSVLRAAAIPALASLAATAAVSAAPVSFGDNTYDVVFDDQITWDAARDAASAAGGSLAVISSAEEQSFIEGLLLDREAATGSYWFGLEETSTEGQYEAINGETLSFNNFAAGEPNNGGGGIEETVGGVYWTSDADAPDAPGQLARRGDWNDLPEVGYPNDETPTPTESDLFRAGYLVEFAGDDTGGGGGDDGGSPTPIPIPAAALMFPGTAAIAYLASRRMRRRR